MPSILQASRPSHKSAVLSFSFPAVQGKIAPKVSPKGEMDWEKKKSKQNPEDCWVSGTQITAKDIMKGDTMWGKRWANHKEVHPRQRLIGRACNCFLMLFSCWSLVNTFPLQYYAAISPTCPQSSLLPLLLQVPASSFAGPRKEVSRVFFLLLWKPVSSV